MVLNADDPVVLAMGLPGRSTVRFSANPPASDIDYGLVTHGGAMNVTGDTNLSAKLNVGTNATFVSSVTAKSDMAITGTATVTGYGIFQSTVQFNGGATGSKTNVYFSNAAAN